MIPVAEALAAIGRIEPLGIESAPIGDAAGRVLAEDVRADLDLPPFDTSAMDGYAVRLEDVPEPGAELAEREERVAAGDRPPAPLRPGEAARVMTGAPLPDNTDAVIPVEEARRRAGRVRFQIAPAPGAHLRRRGEIVAAGTALLARGRRLDAVDVALAALAGADPIRVFRRPRISIAVTGNEIVPVSARPRAGQLRDSNGPMLTSLCRRHGASVVTHSRVADDPDSVARLFADAGRTEDLLVTSGGVSAGDFDLLPAAAEAAGFETLFHGVAMRPGKPVAFARRGGIYWLGLPGNPVSAAVCFHLFGRPAAGRLEGESAPGATLVTAALTRDLAATGPRQTYRDAIWEIEDGASRVAPLSSAGSHDIASFARANALIRQPAGSPRLPAGTVVECLLLGTPGGR